MSRPVPVPDDVTEPFWSSLADGALRVQRCGECRRYQHPPAALCRGCASAELAFESVSGRALLHSWSEVRSGARHPAFVQRTPYLLGLARLIEQDDLFMYTNLPGARIDELRAGIELELVVERSDQDVALPQFRLVAR